MQYVSSATSKMLLLKYKFKPLPRIKKILLINNNQSFLLPQSLAYKWIKLLRLNAFSYIGLEHYSFSIRLAKE